MGLLRKFVSICSLYSVHFELWNIIQVIDERTQEIQESGGMAKLREKECGRRLAFLDLLLEMVEQGTLPKEDVRPEVDTFMFGVRKKFPFNLNCIQSL